MKRKKALFHSSLVFLGIFAAILAAEVAARLFTTGEIRYASNLFYDPVLGFRGPEKSKGPPGLSFRYLHGTRNIIAPPAVQGATKRALFLGDSFTEAGSVKDRDTFPYKTTELLAKRGIKLRPSILALGDWGPVQYALAYQQLEMNRESKIVVMQFFGLNDFTNSGIDFAERYQSRTDTLRPYIGSNLWSRLFGFPHLGNLEITYKYPMRKILRDSSRLFSLLERPFIIEQLQPKKLPSSQCDEYHVLPLTLFLKKESPEWRRASDAVRLTVRELKKILQSRSHPPKLVAFYIPSNLEISDDYWRGTVENRIRNCRPEEALDRWGPESRFLRIFAEEGISAYSLRAAFSASKQGTSLYTSDGHLSEKGHALTARMLAGVIHKELSD